MLWCSVKGLPVHARLPHRISRAYNVSCSGPWTLTPDHGHRSTARPRSLVKRPVGRVGLEPTTGGL
jgi:hypothetical protein